MMRLLVALALVPLASAAASSPVLSGLYSVGDLGLVEFTVLDGKTVGKLKLSEQCVFAPDSPVVSGTFEGGVFLGQVTLCQTGPRCPAQRTYPILGVAHDDAIAGLVRLDVGCQSAVLDGKALFFRPATIEERQKIAGSSSAAALAQKQGKGDGAAQAEDAISDAQRLIQEQKYGPAREKFRQALTLDESRWEAFMGYGLTEVKLSHPERSLEYFDKALSIAQARRAPPASVAQVHYNRACAQVAMGDKKGALASLKLAVRVGGSSALINELTEDPDLNAIRNEPDFRQLVANALLQHNRKKPK